MSYTLEELKNMIDSNVMENGRSQITGKTLNLTLHRLAEAIYNISINDIDNYIIKGDIFNGGSSNEEMESNILTYNNIISSLEQNLFPRVSVRTELEGKVYNYICTGLILDNDVIYITCPDNIFLKLGSDGLLLINDFEEDVPEIEIPEEPETPVETPVTEEN